MRFKIMVFIHFGSHGFPWNSLQLSLIFWISKNSSWVSGPGMTGCTFTSCQGCDVAINWTVDWSILTQARVYMWMLKCWRQILYMWISAWRMDETGELVCCLQSGVWRYIVSCSFVFVWEPHTSRYSNLRPWQWGQTEHLCTSWLRTDCFWHNSRCNIYPAG